MCTRHNIAVVNISADPELGNFEEVYKELLDKLNEFFNVLMVTTVQELKDHLLHKAIKVMLFVNKTVAHDDDLKRLIMPFVDRPAMVIFACFFPSTVPLPEMSLFFNEIELPWQAIKSEKKGHEITAAGRTLLGQIGQLAQLGQDLDDPIIVEGVPVIEVADGDKLYGVPPSTATENGSAFPPLVPNPNTSVALKKFGNGAMAYVGDTKVEPAMNRIIVALCNVGVTL